MKWILRIITAPVIAVLAIVILYIIALQNEIIGNSKLLHLEFEADTNSFYKGLLDQFGLESRFYQGDSKRHLQQKRLFDDSIINLVVEHEWLTV